MGVLAESIRVCVCSLYICVYVRVNIYLSAVSWWPCFHTSRVFMFVCFLERERERFRVHNLSCTYNFIEHFFKHRYKVLPRKDKQTKINEGAVQIKTEKNKTRRDLMH